MSQTFRTFSVRADSYTVYLHTSTKSRCERPGLGNVLLQHAPFMRMYADYVRNFDQAVELVRTWTERSSAFRNIIQDIQVSRLNLSSYFYKGVRAGCDVCIILC